MEALSALVDGEQVGDVAVLAEALSAPEGRAALLDYVRLRTVVRGDDGRPRPQFYEKVRPILARPSRWSAPRRFRRIAAAVILVLGTAGLVDLSLRLRERPADQPPHATRVLRFEPGVDWQVSER